MKTRRTEFAGRIATDRVFADIGTSSLTGVKRDLFGASAAPLAAHPIYRTAALAASDCAALGSDCQRVGFIFDQAFNDEDEEFVDAYGVGWIGSDSYPAPATHPLQKADWKEIARYPKPRLPAQAQLADPGRLDLLTVLDAPCPGLLDTSFALRNAWQFLNDLTENWRLASALLDWAADNIEMHYSAVLAALPTEPDVIIYGDDLGFQSGMYLSDEDFRNFLYPRMQNLFSRLRRLSGAAICLHSCGAIRPIVRDLAGFEVEIVNLDFYARNMILKDVRRDMPAGMVLHAPVNLAAIGQAVREDNAATLALLACELAEAMPAIAAPLDNIGTAEALEANIRGIAFVRALDAQDVATLRNVGPVRSIVEKARQAAAAIEIPELGLDLPSTAELETLRTIGNMPARTG